MADPTVIDTPGVYNLPEHVYHQDPVPGGSLSSSGARRLLPPSCPALFHHWRGQQSTRTKAMDFGTAAHKRLLGVGAQIVVVDADDWRTKEAQRQKKEAHAAGAVPLLLRDYVRTREMEKKLRSHSVAGRLFTPGRGLVEQSLFWVDPEFEVWRRARLDLLIPGSDTEPLWVIDYKTTVALDKASMSSSMAKFGYAAQGAWYLDGIDAVGLTGPAGAVFVLVFQMSEPPYLVRVAQPEPEAIQWGRVKNRKALETYRDCTKRDEWPGFPEDEVVSLTNPRWVEYQLEAAWDSGELMVSSDYTDLEV